MVIVEASSSWADHKPSHDSHAWEEMSTPQRLIKPDPDLCRPGEGEIGMSGYRAEVEVSDPTYAACSTSRSHSDSNLHRRRNW